MQGFDPISKTGFSRQIVYDYLEDKLSKLCHVEQNNLIEKYYRIDHLQLKICYGSVDLLTFFHPAIAFIETPPIVDFDGLTIFVAERPAIDFQELMNSMEDSYFEKNGIAYQLGKINNDTVRKRVFRAYGSIKYLNTIRKTGYYLCHQLDIVPKWERSFSFRDLLNWYLTFSPYQLLHGAGIAFGGKGVFLTAKGGSGKSTTTIQCLLQDMQTVGDDFTLVNIVDKTMHCIYNIAKLRPDTYKALVNQNMRSEGVTYYPHNKKYHLDLNTIFKQALIKKVPLNYLFIPVISGQATASFEKATSLQAMNALLPNTLLLLDGNRTQLIKKTQSLLQNLPCYFFHLSKDLTKNPIALKQFLASNK